MQPFIWAEKERYGIEIEETPGCVAEHIAIHRGDRIEALGEHEIAKFMGGGLICFSPKRSKSATKSPLPIAWHHSS